MKILRNFLLWFAMAAVAFEPAFAGTDLSPLGIAAQANTTAQSLKPIPVCNAKYPYLLAGVSGNAASTRTVFYCPQGATQIRLLYSGVYAGANETDYTASIPTKLSVIIEPAPWNATTTYQIGAQVSYYQVGNGSNAFNPFYTAAAANTNSPPQLTNSNWTPGTRSAATIPVTFSGQQDATLPTQTKPNGSVVTKGYIISDPLPITVPVGGYFTIYGWTANTNGFYPSPLAQMGMNWGNGFSRGTSQADQTASTGFVTYAGYGSNWQVPFAIVGVPINPTPSVAIIGDSISDGVNGGNAVAFGAPTIVSGGSGYAIGDIITSTLTGGTAGAVGAGCAPKWIVDNVTSGAITAARLIDGGCFTNTTTQTGQTLPSTTQNISPVTGSGTGGSLTYSGYTANAFNALGDGNGNLSWVQQGLGAAGIPYTSFAFSGDRVSLWRTRSYSRLAAIAASGARTAIIALGRNDLTNGDSAATIEANLAWLAASLKSMGVAKVCLSTITGEVNTTTAAGLSTLAGQTPSANNSTRITVNTWIRSVPAGIDCVLDPAALIMNGGAASDDGTFAPIGGQPASADGKHPSNAGHAAMKAAVAPVVPKFSVNDNAQHFGQPVQRAA